MGRYAVIIGVSKTGGLPTLTDAISNAIDFNEWALSQQFTTTLLTDLEEPVKVEAIRDAVMGYVDSQTATQLIIYFSGHGLIRGPGDEFWLLSDAPRNPDAAVNLQFSRYYSRSSGIPHIVFISDACRTRPTLPEQFGLRGSVIFSYTEGNRTLPDVDMFYATAPGDPALEVEVTEANVSGMQSLYTKLLLEGLHGRVPQIITSSGSNDIVMAYELSQYLKTGVPKALEELNVMRNQRPDAEITSREPLHLSKFPKKPVKRVKPVRPLKGKRGDVMSFETVTQHPDHPRKGVFRDIISFSQELTDEEREFIAIFHEVSEIEVHDFQTGFIVFGTDSLVLLGANKMRYKEESTYRELINLDNKDPFKTTYFLTYEDGRIFPLAILDGFIGRVIFKDGVLISVNYTPSTQSPRYLPYTALTGQLERRRALIAAQSKNGTFRIRREDLNSIEAASYFRALKEFDPTLGIYASYAYFQAGYTEGVQSVYQYMAQQPEKVLYDVALLRDISRNDTSLESVAAAAPFCPMLTQGWSFLTFSDSAYSALVNDFSRHLLPGLWTSFSPQAHTLFDKYDIKDFLL